MKMLHLYVDKRKSKKLKYLIKNIQLTWQNADSFKFYFNIYSVKILIFDIKITVCKTKEKNSFKPIYLDFSFFESFYLAID